jgi:DNA-binding CsgD family transcriptional regulator
VRIAWSPQAGAATGATLDFDPTVSTTPPNAQGLEARLLQRDHEVARIRAGLDSACAGAGVAVVVEGEAGIGKTALLALASAMAQERGMRVLAARASELETDYPFGVVRQCLEPNLHAADAATREELLAGAAALAGPVVLDWRGDAGAESLGVLHGLYWLVANLAQRQPLLLAIDDLHWADEPSQRFVAYLLRRIDSLPVALALATRPAGASAHAEAVLAEVLAAGGPDALAPAPLDESAAAQLLRDVAGGPVDDRFARACRQASGGNPFLLSELVRALRAEGVPFTARGAERVGEITPPQVARVARARLTRLDPRAQALAHAVVVLGDDAPLELASELANVDRAVAATAADELVAAGLIDSQRLLRFRHPLLRSAVAATLTLAERERSHRVAAELLRARGAPPERVAVHLLMTAPIGEGADEAALHDAAVLAVDRGAPAAAVPLYLRLLDEPLGARERADVLLELGRAEYIAGLFGEATGHLEEAYRIAHDPSVRGAALVLLLQASLGSVEALATLADDVPRAVEALRDHDRELALRLQAYAMLMRRDGTDAEQLASFRALAGDTPGEATVLAHLVLQRVRHGASAAEIADLATRAARQVDALIEDGTSTTAFIAVTLGLRWADRLDDAERILERAIEVARQRGSTTDFANALGLRGEVYVRRGLLREAEADARTAQATQLEQGWRFPRALIALLQSLVAQGRAPEAAEVLEAEIGDEALPNVPPMISLLLTRAQVRAAVGDHSGTVAAFDEAVRRRQRWGGASPSWIGDMLVAAESHEALGTHDVAKALRAEAGTLALQWDTPGALGQVARAEALFGDGEDRIERLGDAVALLERSPARLELARALVDLGAALRRAGHRADARSPLRAGYDLARECGAEGLAEDARRELAASGVRIRRARLTGAESLTPSERRIADMAADGNSNAEIAQALFVTVKTVEMHLTHVYRKLDIPGRGELRRALGGCSRLVTPDRVP